ETLLEVQPQTVVCDLHPRYNSTAIAEELGLPVLKVQHHYAHILSCMVENDCQEPVIGVSFDGTGYGTDGTVWGGEILAADYGGFTRIGSIAPFLQIGGDISAKEGWRIAVSLIYGSIGEKESAKKIILELGLCSEAEAQVQLTMAERKLNAIVSTSAGRLFDGVSAILGIRRLSTFEGEASTTLEFAAEVYEKAKGDLAAAQEIPAEGWVEPLLEDQDGRMILNTIGLVQRIVEKRITGEDAGRLAYEFHAGLARQIVAACIRARKENGRNQVALSGGVFQNQLLLRMTDELLKKEGFQVLRHSMIPPNDGGIALGQAAYAMYRMNNRGEGGE
ncbi:MAG: carbamoyltransferase HypF, partial [Dorea sp.]|nr:carbamoyltransferase HypF [Dorea sp.]